MINRLLNRLSLIRLYQVLVLSLLLPTTVWANYTYGGETLTFNYTGDSGPNYYYSGSDNKEWNVTADAFYQSSSYLYSGFSYVKLTYVKPLEGSLLGFTLAGNINNIENYVNLKVYRLTSLNATEGTLIGSIAISGTDVPSYTYTAEDGVSQSFNNEYIQLALERSSSDNNPTFQTTQITNITLTFSGTDYGLSIGNYRVTSNNANNVLGDGTVSYDAEENKLTLSNATINGNITAENDLAVRFVGDNSMQRTSEDMFMFAGNGNNTLTFETDEDNPGELRIIGSISKDDITRNWEEAPSITEVTADGEDEGCDWMVECFDNYTNLKLNKKYPIWLGGHQVTDATTFYSGVSYDRETAVLTYGGYYDSYTIKSSLPNLTIVIEGENQRMQSISFEPTSSVPSGTLTFDIGYNSNVSLSLSDPESDVGVISGFSQVILTNPLKVSNPENFTEWTSSIKNATIASAPCYNINIAGTIVSEVNKDDVLGDGKVSVSVSNDGTGEQTYTVILNNATITPEQEAPGIDYMGSSDLTIRLKGNNIIQGNEGCEAIRYNGDSPTTPNLYFVKDGNQHCSLELIVGEGEDEISGFHTNYDENTFFVYAGDGNGANTHSTIYSTTIMGGTGSADEPHIIASANDLKKFIEYYNDGRLMSNANVRLEDDINCNGVTGFVQLADNTNATFSGVFDGNNKIISNLTLTGSGLFGYIGGGTVKDLTLSNYHLTGTDYATGGIVAELSDGATISNCTITNSTIACAESQYNPEVGGIAARMSGSTITSCIIDNVQVKAETTYTGGSGASGNAGGIVASASGGTISSCIVRNGSKITNFYTDENATLKAGAIVGSLYETTLTQNKYDYDVTVEYLNGTNTDDKIIKSDYTQRGTGEERVISDVSYYDIFEDNGAVMANTKTVSLPSNLGDKGEVEIEDGNYYKKDGDNYQVVVGKNVVVRVGAYEPYSIATFMVPNTSETTFQEIGDGYREYTFVMPDADVTIAVNFSISISSEDYVATIASVTYNGASQVPASVTLTAQDGEEMVLTNSADSNDFTIKSFKLNNETVTSPLDAGTYTVTIEGIGNYTGTKDVEYIINKANFSDLDIATIADQTYTGNEIKPAVKVTFNNHTVSAEEYDSVYTANINAGEATITLTSTGKNFVADAQKTKNFIISPKALTEATITLSETSFAYDGSAKNPSVTIGFVTETSGTGGSSMITLTEDTDYEVTYKKVNGETEESIEPNQVINSGTYKVIATGKGNYSGTKEAEFTISKGTMDVSATGYTGTYDGEPHGITVTAPEDATIKYGTKKGTCNLNESPTYTDAGTYMVHYQVSQNNYNTIADSAKVEISKATPSITFDEQSYSATYGEAFTAPTPTTSPEGLNVTATSSSNTQVASISDGVITIAGVGETTITVSFAGNNNYNATTATYKLNVAAGTTTGVTATGYTGTYDGRAHGITVTAPEDATIKYGTKKGTYNLNESPT